MCKHTCTGAILPAVNVGILFGGDKRVGRYTEQSQDKAEKRQFLGATLDKMNSTSGGFSVFK